MRGIYQNASITIAASTASSVYEGFLKATGNFSGMYPSCSIPVALMDENESRSEQGKVSIVPRHTQKTQDFPINKRGWTYQEALVSPRLLVFGDLEPFLRCQTKEATMRRHTCVTYDADMIKPQRFMNKIKSGPGYNVIYEDGAVIDLRLEFLWKDLMEQYTHRELGLQEDRPIAIAGVIDFISDLTGDKCFYGIWKSCAVACLLWKFDADSECESIRIPGLPS
ncbi:Fc.00g078940.m01.CDS01 [Cosmosporella sp. VM-42]